MAIDVLYDPIRQEGCLCSSSTGEAFGPVLTGIESREQLEKLAGLAEQFLSTTDGLDRLAESLPAMLRSLDWPTVAAFRCLHCEAVVDPEDVKRAMNSAAWHLFEPDVRAACPACGAGDGDFEEVEVCKSCGDVISDAFRHVAACDARKAVKTKPPMPSVQTSPVHRRRRFA